jgi:hypothetical protein
MYILIINYHIIVINSPQERPLIYTLVLYFVDSHSCIRFYYIKHGKVYCLGGRMDFDVLLSNPVVLKYKLLWVHPNIPNLTSDAYSIHFKDVSGSFL